MKAPWHDPTPAAWLAFADYCDDAGKKAERLKALRYAEGLRLRPQMVLVSDLPGEPFGAQTVPWPRGATAWRDGYKHRWLTPSWCAFGSNWGSLTGYWPHLPKLSDCLATPLDFSGMTDDVSCRNVILRSFYYRTSYNLHVAARDGRLWTRVRTKHGYRWGKELGIHA